MIIYAYSQWRKVIEGIEVNKTNEINDGKDLLALSMFDITVNNDYEVKLVETKTNLIVLEFIKGKEKEYKMDTNDIEVLKDHNFKGSYEIELTETEIKSFSSKAPIIHFIKKSDLLELTYENIKQRLEKIETNEIKELILSKLEKEKEKIFNFENRKYESKNILQFSEKVLYLKEGVFNLETCKVEKNILIQLGYYGFTTNSVIMFEVEMPLEKTSTFLLDSYNDEETIENSELRSLMYLPLIIREISEDAYIVYKAEDSRKNANFITLATRKEGNQFSSTYDELKIIEDEDNLEIRELDDYEEEGYKVVLKKRKNSTGDDLTIKNKTFEYDCKIKAKIIEDWNSCLFDIVWLENGELWLYQKDFEEIKQEILLEKDCKEFYFIRDFNNVLTILKTDTNMYYFPRTNFDIPHDQREDLSKYIYKEELTEDLKGNTFIKVPFDKKYSKANKLWTLKYLPAIEVKYDGETTTLENMTEDYFLYSPYEAKAKLKLNNKEYIFTLSDRYPGTKNYEGGDIFNTQKVKRWPGMEKVIIKDSSTENNYILFKSKGKKIVFLYVKQEDGTYKEAEKFHFYDGNELCGEGFSYFNDKNLPDIYELVQEGSRSYNKDLKAIYLTDNEYEEIITPQDPYETPKIKKGQR